jgi:hypothetical protein
MASLRSRTALEETNSNPKAERSQTSKSQQKPNVSKKRKAENEAQEDHNEENLHRPSTPPAASKVWSSPQPGESELAHLPSYERTPGRVGPIKTVNFDIKPDIKPFKGPPGKKVRKTAWEKDQEYKQFVRENEGHVFHQ